MMVEKELVSHDHIDYALIKSVTDLLSDKGEQNILLLDIKEVTRNKIKRL